MRKMVDERFRERSMFIIVAPHQGKFVVTFLDSSMNNTLRSTVALITARGCRLGIARPIAAGYSNIVVTAPSYGNLKTVFDFVCKGFSALDSKYIELHEHENLSEVGFFAKNSQVVLVVDDEVATILQPLVKSLLCPYVVFLSSTVNGCRGMGRSLSLKLIQQWEQQSQAPTHSVDDSTSEKLGRCSHNLPEELWVEIMAWLPVYSLLRCKSIQKSWHHLINTLIHDRIFVARHLKNSTERLSLFILSHRHRPFFDRSEFAFATICNANGSDHIDTIIEAFDLSAFIKQDEISFPGSHCNGIVCLCVYNRNNILLFNPAIREYKQMTSSCFGPWKIRKQKILVGLGHDLIDDVHKVIRVVYRNCGFVGAEIHTLGIDHHDTWREINIEAEFCRHCTGRIMDQELEYEGIIYWLARGCCSGNPKIVLFDVHDEKFQTISLPTMDDEFSTTEACLERTYKLALWNGFVTLFKFYRPICFCGRRSACPSRKPIEIWVMQRFLRSPANRSYFWNKHLTISHLEQTYRPLIFWNNDELILKSFDLSCKVGLVSYNIRSQKLRSLQGIPETLDKISGFAFMQSLVSIS